jgi:cyclopropane-fatty-acyl-phospholipid synthase
MTRANRQLEAARRIAAHLAEHLQADLSLKLWDGSVVPLGPGARADILIAINSPAAIRRLLFSPRLMTVVELYASGALDVEGGTPLEAARRWDHMKALRLAKNVRKGLVIRSLWPFLRSGAAGAEAASADFRGRVVARHEAGRDDKELVQFHYDVSNSFYQLFLDTEMVYSPGYFARPDMTLEEAQLAKFDRICRRLGLQPGERLLEIGCGWGGLICHAARVHGVRALGVTLSQQQFDFAQAKVRALGLEDQVTIELRDYRTIAERDAFDAVVQIGMFEHVGIDNHDAFFQLVHAVLRPRGRYLHDAITRRPTRDLRKFRKPTAYAQVISRFIFPGGELDYLGLTITNLERNGFEVHDVEAWREHYQRSLEIWNERLAANRQAAEREVGATKTRLWLLYFALSAMAFERNAAFDFQTLASKRQTGASRLPMQRSELLA